MAESKIPYTHPSPEARELSGGSMDDIKTTGLYHCNGVKISDAGTNSWGALIVIASASKGDVRQYFCYTTNNQLRTRSYHSGAWSEWAYV